MPKLKLTTIPDDSPIKLTVIFTGEQHRLLAAYAEAVSKASGRIVTADKLVPHIVDRFIATDRVFARGKRPQTVASAATSPVEGGALGDP
jgi:hypothetical protein